MILGNETNNDYIAQIIKIEEYCASELTIWEESVLEAGTLSRQVSFSLGTAPILPFLGSLCYFTVSS